MTPPTRPNKTGWLGRILGWAILIAILVLIWPSSLGGATTIVVVSGQSMEPTYHSGDLVVLRKRANYEVGDVIAYRPFDTVRASVIHRITAIDEAGGLMIRGDNNDFDDPFEITHDDIQGAALFMVPKVGKFFVFLSSPWVWISLLLIAVGIYFYPPKIKEPVELDLEE